MKKTYFVYFEQFFDGTSEHIEKNLLVDSDLQGKELYHYIQVCVAGESLVVAKSIIIKNIVCLSDNKDNDIRQIENNHDTETIRVSFKARPDISLQLELTGQYLDRIEVTTYQNEERQAGTYCLEIPAQMDS